MDEQDKNTEPPPITTLEHEDTEESFRQLWWTIGVTVAGLALIAYFYS